MLSTPKTYVGRGKHSFSIYLVGIVLTQCLGSYSEVGGGGGCMVLGDFNSMFEQWFRRSGMCMALNRLANILRGLLGSKNQTTGDSNKEMVIIWWTYMCLDTAVVYKNGKHHWWWIHAVLYGITDSWLQPEIKIKKLHTEWMSRGERDGK